MKSLFEDRLIPMDFLYMSQEKKIDVDLFNIMRTDTGMSIVKDNFIGEFIAQANKFILYPHSEYID